MNITEKRISDKELQLDFSGDFTLGMNSDAVSALDNGIKSYESVTLSLSSVTGFDITSVQLICSSCRSAAKAMHTFLPAGALPLLFNEIVTASGAQRHTACSVTSGCCVWLKGVN